MYLIGVQACSAMPGRTALRGRDGIDDVGLAVAPADQPVRSHHLHHRDLLGTQVPASDTPQVPVPSTPIRSTSP